MPRWTSQIDEAWVGRRNPRWPVTPQVLQATQAMIRDVLQRAGPSGAPGEGKRLA